MPIAEVLSRQFHTDAHFTQGIAPAKEFRIKRAGLELLSPSYQLSIVAFDVDDPLAHSTESGRASDAWFASQLEKLSDLRRGHPGGFVYRTRRGYRLVYSLPQPHVISSGSAADAWALKYSLSCIYLWEKFELVPDPNCKPAFQPFRAPHATRSGNSMPEALATFGRPDELGTWNHEPDTSPTALQREFELVNMLCAADPQWKSARASLRNALPAQPSQRRSPRPARVRVSAEAEAAQQPPRLSRFVRELSDEVRLVRDGRHELYLALAGALCSAEIPSSGVMAIVTGVARSGGDPKAAKRIADAQSTVDRYHAGTRTTGLTTLRHNWPRVAKVVSQYLAPTPSTVTQVPAGAARRVLSLRESEQELKKIVTDLANAEGGTVLVRVPMGVGKTTTVLDALLALGIRTGAAHPSNRVAEEQFGRMSAAAPTAVTRRFGVLALRDNVGNLVCKLERTVELLQEGGVPVPQKLCIRCEFRQGCAAFKGREGAPAGLIHLGSHGLLPVLSEHAENGALVLDELPRIIEHRVITPTDLRVTGSALQSCVFHPCLINVGSLLLGVLEVAAAFKDPDFKQSMVRAIIGMGEGDVRVRLTAAEQTARLNLNGGNARDAPEPLADIGPRNDTLEWLEALFLATLARWPNQRVPPMTRATAQALATNQHLQLAADVASASSVLGLLGRVLDPRMTEKDVHWNGEGHLSIQVPNEALMRAVARCKRVIVLDGTANIEAVRKLAGAKPLTIHEWDTSDGAPVERVHLVTSNGAKSKLSRGRGMRWSAFGPLLADALGHCKVGTILVVTHKPCASALMRGVARRIPHARTEATVRDWLGRNGQLVFAHFGAVRGRNAFDDVTWEELDGVITIGDPWPDIDVVGREAGVLGIEPDSDEWINHITAAELDQAHGRLRAPRQSKPTIAIHVGRVRPRSWGEDAQVIERPAGRPPIRSAIAPETFAQLVQRAGGFRAVAQTTKKSERSLRAYTKGERPVPLDVVQLLEEVLA